MRQRHVFFSSSGQWFLSLYIERMLERMYHRFERGGACEVSERSLCERFAYIRWDGSMDTRVDGWMDG